MFNSHHRLYDVKFQLSCLTAESPMFAIIAMCPEIEEMVFERKGISDTEWRKIEHVIGSCSINLVHVEKEPHIPSDQEVTEEETDEEGIDINEIEEDKRVPVLLDDLLHRRETIHEIAADTDRTTEDREKEILAQSKDFTLASTALMNEIKRQVIQELFDAEQESD